MGARCLDQEVRTALGVLLNEHVPLNNFIVNYGYDREKDHDYGPDVSSLKKVRKAWPFVAEPNPTLMDPILMDSNPTLMDSKTKKELVLLSLSSSIDLHGSGG